MAGWGLAGHTGQHRGPTVPREPRGREGRAHALTGVGRALAGVLAGWGLPQSSGPRPGPAGDPSANRGECGRGCHSVCRNGPEQKLAAKTPDPALSYHLSFNTNTTTVFRNASLTEPSTGALPVHIPALAALPPGLRVASKLSAACFRPLPESRNGSDSVISFMIFHICSN